jgi:uncharacterized protein (DUF2235 family)
MEAASQDTGAQNTGAQNTGAKNAAGKNIVVLSDGTGNLGAKAQGTNVWALYERLERGPGTPRQIAFYDDGVGSQGSLPAKLLGGAFGWGLYRNVQELYTFLVRTYVPGDALYLFGFSRGGYTVRTLAGLVARYGILKRDPFRSEADLATAIERTCRSQRATFAQARRSVRRGRAAPPTVRPPTVLPPTVLPPTVLIRGLTRDDFHHTPRPGLPHGVDVRFLGVWDSVDAVGLPFDSWAEALNRVYQWRFADRRVSPRVACARQALALDDARRTFSPNLWDESREPVAVEGERPRVEQVWFAGVHTNVGGGYDKDQLAYLALDWMLAEAVREGLRFAPDEHDRLRRQADPLGLMMDSRTGLGALYRPQARHVALLARAAGIRRPRVHASVLERCREAPLGYAPVGIARRVSLVHTTRQHGATARILRLPLERTAWRRARRFGSLERALHPALVLALVAPGLLALAGPCREGLRALCAAQGRIAPLAAAAGVLLLGLLAFRHADAAVLALARSTGLTSRALLAAVRVGYGLALAAAAGAGAALALAASGFGLEALARTLPRGAPSDPALTLALWYGLACACFALLRGAFQRPGRRAALDAFAALRRPAPPDVS